MELQPVFDLEIKIWKQVKFDFELQNNYNEYLDNPKREYMVMTVLA